MSNISSNHETSTDEEYNEIMERMRIDATIITTISIVATLIGNLLLICVLFNSKKENGRRNIPSHKKLILHLCISDICYAIFALLPTLMLSMFYSDIKLNEYVCKFHKYLSLVPMYSSSFLLVAISVDRYYAICKPFKRLNYNIFRTSKFFASVAWSSALICSIPNFILWGETELGYCDVSSDKVWMSKANIGFFILTAWILPCIIAGTLYYHVYISAYKKNDLKYDVTKENILSNKSFTKEKNFMGIMKNIKNSTKTTILDCKEAEVIVNRQNHNKQSYRRTKDYAFAKKKKYTIKLTSTIITVSFMMYAPFTICNLMDFLNIRLGDGIVATYVLFLGNLNSCTNPVIYFYFNFRSLLTLLVDFKNFIKRWFLFLFKSNDTSSSINEDIFGELRNLNS
uniref:G_PROTEIN_RECEP_F1_2 domain-containing protein n=1 Tax=Parastrongyloides trichosuri TaxID=131310 RepID=A0A0N4Z563_PARTI